MMCIYWFGILIHGYGIKFFSFQHYFCSGYEATPYALDTLALSREKYLTNHLHLELSLRMDKTSCPCLLHGYLAQHLVTGVTVSSTFT
jgi:hypothetical protein